ncbi:MAG: hypothetical protein ACYDC1_02490 [Limisphaerales bacterium]
MKFPAFRCGLALVLGVVALATEAPRITVEVEEDVYSFTPANNGAGPLWCHGSTCLVRDGDRVLATGLETIPDAPPLNNCRWTLWERKPAGWSLVFTDREGRTREPSPLALVGEGAVLVSANPTLTAVGQSGGGPARPVVFEFATTHLANAPRVIEPAWKGKPAFTEHSYRSLASDPVHGDWVLFQNIGYGHAEWTWHGRGAEGAKSQGQLTWPFGADYAKPQPIRVCYPNVALRGGQVHFVGVSDIIEPNPAWRTFKKELTGQEWDYDFRRLFYTWSRDLATDRFEPWIELASREKTGGWITPGDLWLDRDDRAHVVWTERALDERLHPLFFPEAKQRWELNYAVLRDGRIEHRSTLASLDEGQAGLTPGRARFHALPDGRLFVLACFSGTDAGGRNAPGNRLVELRSEGVAGSWQTVPFEKPFEDFVTATPRAGSSPSNWIDLLGTRVGASSTLSYARVRID